MSTLVTRACSSSLEESRRFFFLSFFFFSTDLYVLGQYARFREMEGQTFIDASRWLATGAIQLFVLFRWLVLYIF